MKPRSKTVHLPIPGHRSLSRRDQGGQCRASPVTSGSLELTPSSITYWVCSQFGLCAILDAYPLNPPNQVRFRYVPIPFYGFLQTPPPAKANLGGYPLVGVAIRITFPVNRAVSASCAEERPRHSANWVCRPRRANKMAAQPWATEEVVKSLCGQLTALFSTPPAALSTPFAVVVVHLVALPRAPLANVGAELANLGGELAIS